MRDPMEEPIRLFSPLKDKKAVLIENLFELKAVIYNPNSKKAYINNELYTEGDLLDGYKIKLIDPDKVILTKDGKDFVLKIE